MAQSKQTHFGFKEVAIEEKAPLVQGVFQSVAGRYDLMNDLMSMGVHRLWKDHLIDQIKPREGQRFLDVAGGTGDIAFRILDAIFQRQRHVNQSRVSVLDLTEAMLIEGRNRAQTLPFTDRLDWQVGDAMALPFPDHSFDVYTIAFGLRNVTEPAAALREGYRVLKPGGRLFCLEFSKVVLPVFDRLYDSYSFNLLPKLGQWVTGDADSYQYLVESIRQFPNQDALASLFREAGLERVRYSNLSGGIVAIHQGWRL